MLISVMYANNEVGSIQPLAQIAAIAHAAGIPFHVDATQAAGVLDLHASMMQADLVSLSAHKFYGPKGVGVLAVRRSVAIDWQQHGGGRKAGVVAGPKTSRASSVSEPRWPLRTRGGTSTQPIAGICVIVSGTAFGLACPTSG